MKKSPVNNSGKRDEAIDLARRSHIKWTPPVVVSIVLPAHAATSVVPCAAAPVMQLKIQSKCAGSVIAGKATVTILSDGDPIEILDITHDAPQGNTISIDPAPPATVTDTEGIDIVWEGPGSDAITCLPLDTISFTVRYTCELDPDEYEASFNLTEVLASVLTG